MLAFSLVCNHRGVLVSWRGCGERYCLGVHLGGVFLVRLVVVSDGDARRLEWALVRKVSQVSPVRPIRRVPSLCALTPYAAM
eukprot:2149480-Pleurochrysis_carterae.AAC.6